VKQTVDVADLAVQYGSEIGHYERLGRALEGAIHSALLDAGITHTITQRPKDFASLARKALRKGYHDPMRESKDLVGVRVTIPFASLRRDVVDVVHARFETADDDDKVATYGARELGYLGYHVQVGFKAGDVQDPELATRTAELQVQTRAEAAWADASHDLTYKAALALPSALERRVNRLLALVELFDLEMDGAQTDVLKLDGFPAARMLQVLDRSFLPLARRDYDRELSSRVLTVLAESYEPEEFGRFDVVMDRFVATEKDKLRATYGRWADDAFAHPLLFQPESLVVFERLDQAPVRLRDVWDQSLPSDLLDSLAEIWGHAVWRPGDTA
jgi:ppGpp synthetase/RelA/SpoT-type nucleotidyltranferase